MGREAWNIQFDPQCQVEASQVSEYASQAKGQLFQKSVIHRYTSTNEDRTIYKAESPWHPGFGDSRVVVREDASADKGLSNLSIPNP